MEFGLSPIPGFLFFVPLFALRFCPDPISGGSEFFYFQPLLFRGVCCPAFSSELLFFLPSCSFFFRAAVFLLRCPVPCCLFPLPSFLASFPVRPLPARPLPARPLSSRPLPRVPSFPHAFFSRLLSRALSFPRASSRAPLPARLFLHALFSRVSHLPSPPTLFPA